MGAEEGVRIVWVRTAAGNASFRSGGVLAGWIAGGAPRLGRERRVERLLLRLAEGDAGIDGLQTAAQAALAPFRRMGGEERLDVLLRRRIAERADGAGEAAQRGGDPGQDVVPVRL